MVARWGHTRTDGSEHCHSRRGKVSGAVRQSGQLPCVGCATFRVARRSAMKTVPAKTAVSACCCLELREERDGSSNLAARATQKRCVRKRSLKGKRGAMDEATVASHGAPQEGRDEKPHEHRLGKLAYNKFSARRRENDHGG